ncbi:unnamed protein product [Urochloa humidicola]
MVQRQSLILHSRSLSSLMTPDFFLLYVLLGAVPFPSYVPRLKQLGIVTLNQPYETLVPASLYQADN